MSGPSLIVTGVDTGMLGALVTVQPDGRPLGATILLPGKRDASWSTPDPRQLAMVSGQMTRHVTFHAPDCVAYEQVSVTRGVAAARSLFMCEAMLLRLTESLGLSAWPVQQQTLRGWVKKRLGIAKWEKGRGKQQVMDALGPLVMQELVELTGTKVPEKRWPDLADAYLCARWAQHTIRLKTED